MRYSMTRSMSGVQLAASTREKAAGSTEDTEGRDEVCCEGAAPLGDDAGRDAPPSSGVLGGGDVAGVSE